MRFRKQAPLEVADAARDPPQSTARSHIAGTTKATPDNPDWKLNSYGLTLK
jgi:hypothetical protein